MFHVHARGMPYVAKMLGLKQVYPGRYEPDRIVRMREDEGVTFSHCVPTILQMVMGAGADWRLDNWRIVIGGSAFTRKLSDSARAMGATLIAGYGMSETRPVTAIARAGTDRHDAIGNGTPIPLVGADRRSGHGRSAGGRRGAGRTRMPSSRFYEVPGFGHSLSDNFNASWDFLTALENWRERAIPPGTKS